MKQLAILSVFILLISCGAKNTKTVVATKPAVEVEKVAATIPSETVKVIVPAPDLATVASVATEPIAENVDEGRKLYENNCAKCHSLFAPKEFSKENWKPILISMQKKAHLNDEEMNKISAYIDSEL